MCNIWHSVPAFLISTTAAEQLKGPVRPRSHSGQMRTCTGLATHCWLFSKRYRVGHERKHIQQCALVMTSCTDVVHGTIELEHLDFIDSEPFQRLRYLQQLGCTSYVFPGATHTRHAHSMGVGYLSGHFANKLLKEQGASLDMTERDVVCVSLAGLCHDLGHGPFSHAWDRFLTAKNMSKWKHEEMSGQLLDYIRDTQHIDSLTDDECSLIKQLITGKKGASCEKAYLFDIVANERNSVDVDKLDYLPRDAYHCGVSVCCDLKGIIPAAKVINNEVCFAASQLAPIRNIFETRALLHETVYTDTRAKAVELMVMEALLVADPVLRMSEKMQQCETFLSLDDDMLRLIEMYHIHFPQLVHDGEDAPLKSAQHIIKRLRRRQLYQFVHQVTIPGAVMANLQLPSSADICSHWHSNGEVRLDPDQVCVDVARIDWSMKQSNPLEHVRWYTRRGDVVETQQLTGLMPKQFQEHKLRVYSKTPDAKVADALAAALDSYYKSVVRGSNKEALVQPTANGSAHASSSYRTTLSSAGDTPSPSRRTVLAFDPDTPSLKRKHRPEEDDT